ncbi:MAG: hypothetical protein A2W25_05630 [candidate division Zixibacteria bacterium RBG_16_53_22]|nr:MAG: hypothetical protein A2W25_05630 [candidate division Zixibacteria bacterium RBG_16_53_22]
MERKLFCLRGIYLLGACIIMAQGAIPAEFNKMSILIGLLVRIRRWRSALSRANAIIRMWHDGTAFA